MSQAAKLGKLLCRSKFISQKKKLKSKKLLKELR